MLRSRDDSVSSPRVRRFLNPVSEAWEDVTRGEVTAGDFWEILADDLVDFWLDEEALLRVLVLS